MKKYGDKYFNDYFLKAFHESGYTQAKLATELGVKLYTFNRWLRKERSVDENIINQICNIFKVNESEIIDEYKPIPDKVDKNEKWEMLDLYGCKNMYMVSSYGRVWSICKNKEIVQSYDERGYPKLSLEVNKKTHTYKVHRLVAMTFLPNPEGLREVNHIDGNKKNNNIDNLEWVSTKENVNHAFEIGLHSRAKPIKVVETGEVFCTMEKFKREYNIKSSSFARKALLQGKIIKGVHIEYA